MKRFTCVLVFICAAALGFSFEFSPFVRRIVDASPQQLIETMETTGSGTFNSELVYLVNSLSYRSPYFYSYDRLDPVSVRQLTDYLGWSASGEDVRWIWDKVWNVLMIGSGLIYDQHINAYEADLNRIYELACRPVDIRKSRYENDLIGFARLLTQPAAQGRRVWLPQPGIPAAWPPAYTPSPAPAPAFAYSPAYPAPAPAPVVTPAKIVPKMPNPADRKAYRIQVGSYLGIDFALEAVTRLRQAGLSPAYEIHGEYYRVVIPAVPSADMAIAAQLLGSAGFKEAWIREEW